MKAAGVLAIGLVAVTVGCVDSSLSECGSGLVCPLGTVCAPAGDRCASPEQIAACAARDEEAACTYLGFEGSCRAGLCDIGSLSPFTVHISLPGPGAGRVTSQPPGIDCGSTCSASFPAGTRVVLTATPLTASSFAGWSGPCSGVATCEVTVTAAITVSAIFLLPPAPTIADLLPERGTGVGGDVVILGTDFTGATALTFNGVEQRAFTVVTPTRIETTVPAGARSGPVVVTAPGGIATSRPFTVILADVEAVTGLNEAVSGCVEVGFVVAQEQSLPANVLVEVDPGTGSFARASAAPGGPSTQGLATSPQGTAHAFIWDSTRDLPHRNAGDVRVRVSATVAFQAGSTGRVVTRVITVRNGVNLAAPVTHAPAAFASWSTLGDVDRDGWTDVMTGSFASGAELYFGDGRGGFRAAVTVPLEGLSESGHLADVNADGKLDFLTDRDVAVLLGNGDGTFVSTGLTTLAHTFWIATADVDGDGKVDLLVTDREGRLATAHGNGDGTFEPTVGHGVFTMQAPAVADVDRDGNIDVVIVDSEQAVTLLGDGAGRFPRIVTSPRPFVGRSALADLDGDGVLDLVLAGGIGGAILRGTGTGAFVAAAEFGAWSGGPGLAVGDVSGDGKPDIVVLAAAQRPSILVFGPDGATEGSFVLPDDLSGSSVAIVDLDGDGRRDVLVMGRGLAALRNVTVRACETGHRD